MLSSLLCEFLLKWVSGLGPVQKGSAKGSSDEVEERRVAARDQVSCCFRDVFSY